MADMPPPGPSASDLQEVTVTRVHRVASKFGITELFEELGAEQFAAEQADDNEVIWNIWITVFNLYVIMCTMYYVDGRYHSKALNWNANFHRSFVRIAYKSCKKGNFGDLLKLM